MPVTEATSQLFPPTPRVFYAKAPILDVICQIRFPAELAIEVEPPVEFQRRVKADFPILNKHTRSIIDAVPPELAKAIQAVAPPSGTNTTWQFNTEDNLNTLELAKDNLTLTSKKYHNWEDFYGLFEKALATFISIYEPRFMVRIGLRYRDLIQRSALGLMECEWQELLQDHILGEMSRPEVRGRAIEAARNIVLALPELEAKVRLQHGFAEREHSSEQCYLIDCDFSVGKTEVSHANRAIEYLHSQASDFFRWCITDRLHNAMEPRDSSTE